MNKFEQLVNDLETGDLKPTHIRQAYIIYINHREDLSVEVKDLLCKNGLIDVIFKLLFQTVGFIELSNRRGNKTQYDL